MIDSELRLQLQQLAAEGVYPEQIVAVALTAELARHIVPAGPLGGHGLEDDLADIAVDALRVVGRLAPRPSLGRP